MAFWGIEVKPEEPFTIKSENFDRSLMLTQATLGIGSSSEKSILQVKVGDKEPIFLCTLLPEKSECFTLNLQFEEEDDVTFSVVGPTSIHLSGILENPHDEEDDDDDARYNDLYGEDMAHSDSEDALFDSEDDSEDDSDDESTDDEDASMYLAPPARKSGVVIEEIEDEEKPVSDKSGNKQAKKKKEETSALELKSEDKDGHPVSTADKGKKKQKENVSKDDGKSASNLKRKVDAMDEDQEPKSDTADENKKNKKKNKKKAKTEKDGSAATTKQNAAEVASVKQDSKPAEKKISKAVEETKKTKPAATLKTYANGLIVEDLQPGKPNGKKATRGRKVSVRYIGKLKKGGNIFDSNISGKPFKFKLGTGQVIKGWDAGVEGMQVGGKRRLTIPPSMGYGPEGAKPQIPPNAWLLFDVELVDVA